MFPTPVRHWAANPIFNNQQQSSQETSSSISELGTNPWITTATQTSKTQSTRSKTVQTDFTTSHPTLTPLAYALQEGHWEDAVILVNSNAKLGFHKQLEQFTESFFQSVNQAADPSAQSEQETNRHPQKLLTFEQAEKILNYLKANLSTTEILQSKLYDHARIAIDSSNQELAALYISLLDAQSFNTRRASYRPTLTSLALQNQIPEIAKYCIEKGEDVFQVSSRSENLILQACRHNQPSIIPFLVEKGLDINAEDFHGETALHQAVQRDRNQLLEVLLIHGAQPNMSSLDGETPLHMAINLNNLQGFQLLLDYGAYTNFPNADGIFPIQQAVMENRRPFVEALIAENTPIDTIDETGRNLIQLAQFYNATNVIPLLINAGILRTIRNDAENAHDSVVNERFNTLYRELCNYIPESERSSFEKVETELRTQLIFDGQFFAAQTLNTIRRDGIVPMAHLNNATEQDILALIWTIIEQPAWPSDHAPEETIATLDRDLLKESLFHRLQDAWIQDQQETVCASGRANRLLDTFNGVYAGLQVVTQDMVRREMLDKASILYHEFAQLNAQQSESPQDYSSENRDSQPETEALRTFIREKLTHDYVTSGILSQSLFDRLLNEWIGFIE